MMGLFKRGVSQEFRISFSYWEFRGAPGRVRLREEAFSTDQGLDVFFCFEGFEGR